MDIEKLKPTQPKEQEPYRRRVWVSVVLSFVGYGLPLIYCGYLRAGILVEIGYFVLCFILDATLALVPSFATSFIVVLLSIAVLVVFLVFIVRLTRDTNLKNVPRLNRVWMWILSVFILSTALFLLEDIFNNKYFIEAYKIPSTAMAKNLLVGDYLMASKGIDTDDLQRGDIIIFKYPKDPEQNYIKRLIGKADDRIRIDNKQVYLNGEKLDEPYTQHIDTCIYPYKEKRSKWGFHIRDSMPEIIIPEGKLFVMGDNRDNSSDSRFFGFVDEELVIGKAMFIHFSWDSENNRVRWDRIGMRLDLVLIIQSE
ncbi:MAG: signal peptidase I [candidate division Zixibacteria bacterium]